MSFIMHDVLKFVFYAVQLIHPGDFEHGSHNPLPMGKDRIIPARNIHEGGRCDESEHFVKIERKDLDIEI